MKRSHTAIVFSLVAAAITGSMIGLGAAPDGVEITRGSGGSIKTVLSQSIVLNEDSSLQREWIAIKHAAMPVKVKDTPGVRTEYESGRGYSGNYQYAADFEIEVTEPVSAIEIRFITFDVWGERGKSLVMTEIRDYPVGVHKLEGTWSLYSENEASEYYASVVYVARVRTKDGKVIASDVRPVVDEAKKFYAKFSESDLDPEKPVAPGK